MYDLVGTSAFLRAYAVETAYEIQMGTKYNDIHDSLFLERIANVSEQQILRTLLTTYHREIVDTWDPYTGYHHEVTWHKDPDDLGAFLWNIYTARFVLGDTDASPVEYFLSGKICIEMICVY